MRFLLCKTIAITAAVSVAIANIPATASALPSLTQDAEQTFNQLTNQVNDTFKSPMSSRKPTQQEFTASKAGFVVDGVYLSKNEARFVRLVNEHRAKHGRKPLRVSQQLTDQARQWSAVQAREGKLFHSTDNVYENVAYNSSSPSADQFIKQWKNSPGHNRNILQPGVTWIGFGHKSSSNEHYATAQFI